MVMENDKQDEWKNNACHNIPRALAWIADAPLARGTGGHRADCTNTQGDSCSWMRGQEALWLLYSP